MKPFLYNWVRIARLHNICKLLTSKNIKVVMYHGIVDDNETVQCWWHLKKSKFIKQINYIKKFFSIISLDQACNILSGNEILSANSVVITFDDGYRNYLTHALPLLKENNIPSTLFIPVGPVENKELIWADQLYLTLYLSDINIIDLTHISLGFWTAGTEKKKIITIMSIIELLKKLSVNERRGKIKEIYNTIDFSLNEDTIEMSPFLLLSPEEIVLLSKESLVIIGSHAVTHEPLTSLSPESADEEINESKKYLEKLISKRIDHFCYPAGFHNELIKCTVEEAGYKTAVLDNIYQNKTDDLYRIPRIGIGAFDSDAFFECQVNGVVALKNKLKERFHPARI